MAGGGIGDLFGALGGGLSALAGQQPSSGGGGGGGGGSSDTGVTPANAASTVFTDPTATAPVALTAGDPTGQGAQQPQQPPQGPTFTQAPPQQPQPVPYLPPQQREAAMSGAPTSPSALAAAANPNAAAADPNSAQPITAQLASTPLVTKDPNISAETKTGLSPQAEVASGYQPPQATDADLQQAAEEQGRKQGAVGASSVTAPPQQQETNPLQTAGRFLTRMADRTPGPPTPGSGGGGGPGGGFNLIKALGDLITQGPGAFMQDLQGLTNQVGNNYGSSEPASQGGARGYGYGADQPPAQTAASGPPPQQSSAPQPPTPQQGSPETQAAQAEQDVQAEIAAQEAQRNPAAAAEAATVAGERNPAAIDPNRAQATGQQPAAQQASLTTGGGIASQPIAQNEIQISPYSRHGAPPMQPTQPNVDVSPLRNEIGNPRTVHQMAQMVSQEVSLKPGNTRAQIVQLESLRNRALYGIQGNGRYPDGTRAPTSLAQAGQTVHGGPYSRAGYSGYYPDYSNQRVSPQQMEKFKREVYDVVFPPDGSPGSNLSDVGYGPMTGNASNDPRMGERGMVAKHQYLRGTQGYSMRKSGGDDYFREHVRPGDGLGQPGGGATTAQTVSEPKSSDQIKLAGDVVPYTRPYNFPAIHSPLDALVTQFPHFFVPHGGEPIKNWHDPASNTNKRSGINQQTPVAAFSSSPYDKSFTDLYQTVSQLAPGGLPTQDWRRSTNVEEGTVNPLAESGSSPETRADWMAGNQSPQRATLMAAQAGSNDIDPLLDQLAQQWARQLMGEQVPMPRPRPGGR